MSEKRIFLPFFRTLFFAFVALTLLFTGISKLMVAPSGAPLNATAMTIGMSAEALTSIVSLIEIAIALTISYAIIPRPAATSRSQKAGMLSMAMLFVYASGILLAHALYAQHWMTLRFGLGLIYWLGAAAMLGLFVYGYGNGARPMNSLHYAEE